MTGGSEAYLRPTVHRRSRGVSGTSHRGVRGSAEADQRSPVPTRLAAVVADSPTTSSPRAATLDRQIPGRCWCRRPLRTQPRLASAVQSLRDLARGDEVQVGLLARRSWITPVSPRRAVRSRPRPAGRDDGGLAAGAGCAVRRCRGATRLKARISCVFGPSLAGARSVHRRGRKALRCERVFGLALALVEDVGIPTSGRAARPCAGEGEQAAASSGVRAQSFVVVRGSEGFPVRGPGRAILAVVLRWRATLARRWDMWRSGRWRGARLCRCGVEHDDGEACRRVNRCARVFALVQRRLLAAAAALRLASAVAASRLRDRSASGAGAGRIRSGTNALRHSGPELEPGGCDTADVHAQPLPDPCCCGPRLRDAPLAERLAPAHAGRGDRPAAPARAGKLLRVASSNRAGCTDDPVGPARWQDHAGALVAGASMRSSSPCRRCSAA